MKLFRWLFKLQDSEPIPVAGSVYDFIIEQDPFGIKKTHQVEVLEVKDGWVRYSFKDSLLWKNETMTTETFLRLYRISQQQ